MLELLAAMIQYGETFSITKNANASNAADKYDNDGYWRVSIGAYECMRPIPWIGDGSLAMKEAIIGAIRAAQTPRKVEHA
jgi:hypothetical protein